MSDATSYAETVYQTWVFLTFNADNLTCLTPHPLQYNFWLLHTRIIRCVSSLLASVDVYRMLNVKRIVVLYYDYLLTLGTEVRYFWGRKCSLSIFLFFMPRYLVLIGGVPMILKYFGRWSVHVCNSIIITHLTTYRFLLSCRGRHECFCKVIYNLTSVQVHHHAENISSSPSRVSTFHRRYDHIIMLYPFNSYLFPQQIYSCVHMLSMTEVDSFSIYWLSYLRVELQWPSCVEYSHFLYFANHLTYSGQLKRLLRVYRLLMAVLISSRAISELNTYYSWWNG